MLLIVAMLVMIATWKINRTLEEIRDESKQISKNIRRIRDHD